MNDFKSISDVYRRVTSLSRTNQKREALNLLNRFFALPISSDLDQVVFNSLVKVGIELSVTFLAQIPGVVRAVIQNYDNEEMAKFLETYIQECRIMIGDKQQYSAKTKDMINCPISPRTVDELLVNPSINFFFNVFVVILSSLRTLKKNKKLYFKILNRGFNTANEFESQQLHDMMSKELDNLSGNLDIKNSVRFRVVNAIFTRFSTALQLGLHKRAFKALLDASYLISSPDAPIELHEHLEVQKAILLEHRENNVPAAMQLLNLVKFYETTPIPPAMPIQSLIDLALMTALGGDIWSKTDTSYEALLGCKALSRDEVVSILIKKVRRLSLKKFAIVAEEHKNPVEICLAFQKFLTEYVNEFHVPTLFKSLGNYAAYRIIQAALANRNEVPLNELENAIKWLNRQEIHRAIITGNKNGLFKCKINMINNCIIST